MTVDPRAYYQAKYKKISDIDDIGEATVAKLKDIGINTMENLVSATPKQLEEVGITGDTAKKLMTIARKTVALTFVKGDDLLELRKNQKGLTTGCASLDKLLTTKDIINNTERNGVPTQSITEFYGEFGSGKSQLCHQLCVTTQLPEKDGGLNGKVLYIDTEAIFLPERVIEIAKRFPYFADNPRKVLNGVIMAQAYTSDHQIALLEAADEVIKENNVKLIIVDSLTGQFRSEYIGRGMLAERQQLINRHLRKLINLARAFNAAAVCTNQVSATPDAYSYEPKAIGGNIVGHAAHTRVYIRKGRNTMRIMKITASPFMAEGEAPMYLDEYGFHSSGQIVEDDEEEEVEMETELDLEPGPDE